MGIKKTICQFTEINNKNIFVTGAPWAKFILLSTEDDSKRTQLKHEIISDDRIKKIIDELTKFLSGLNTLSQLTSDFHVYGSFYWKLKFLADIGLTVHDLNLAHLIKKLQIQQLETGEFQIHYNNKRQQSICKICITAHLTYCLIRMGLKNSGTVASAINYILTTQRKDAGWHCDRLKQYGEIEELHHSCPSANIHVIKALGLFGAKYENIILPAINQCLSFFIKGADQACIYDSVQQLNFKKLRYPSHYSGMDILNLLTSLSSFSEIHTNKNFNLLIQSILSKWDNVHLLCSEKRISEWSNFEFGKNGKWDSWITSLVINAFNKLYSQHIQI